MNKRSLVQPLFEGPIDIVGDVHGEIEALHHLLHHLGYDEQGNHFERRRLVFVGDLIDRGPDSPAVLDLVTSMIDRGKAQCILGNHELNLLRGKHAPHNTWFRGKPWKRDGVKMPQALLPKDRQDEVLAFVRGLPIALERPDLRVVHACWDDAAIDRLRWAHDAMAEFTSAYESIAAKLDGVPELDQVERNLAHQNDNPVKLITSGPEYRAAAPFEAGGKLRQEARLPWWEEYGAEAFCVCGHYWRIPLEGKLTGDSLFTGCGQHDLLGNRRVMCIDYSVGGRFLERLNGHRQFTGRLAALRWPEAELVFDDGEVCRASASRDRLTPLRGFAPRKPPQKGKNRKNCART